MTRQLDIDLARHPFLFGMTRQDVGLLADCAVRVCFDPNKSSSAKVKKPTAST